MSSVLSLRCRIVESMHALVIDTAMSTGMVAIVRCAVDFLQQRDEEGTSAPTSSAPCSAVADAATISRRAVGTASLAADNALSWMHELELLAQRDIIGHAHNEELVPTIQQLCRENELRPEHIDLVIVGDGPGPFTGLRVGMATAAAFAQAIGRPVFGCCTHDALALSQMKREIPTGENTVVNEITVLTDARRREVYWAHYRQTSTVSSADLYPGLSRSHGPSVSSPQDSELISLLHESAMTIITESSIHSYLAVELNPVKPQCDARSYVAIVAERVRREGYDPQILHPLQPRYLRRPDAAPARASEPSTAIDFSMVRLLTEQPDTDRQ